jgi:hypothetical protein
MWTTRKQLKNASKVKFVDDNDVKMDVLDRQRARGKLSDQLSDP